MLADAGDCVTDLDALRGQEQLFGAVASEDDDASHAQGGRRRDARPGQGGAGARA